MKKLLIMTGVVAMVAALPVRAAETEIFVDTFDLSGATTSRSIAMSPAKGRKTGRSSWRSSHGTRTAGEVLHEVASVASSHAAVDGVFGTFSQEVKICEAGTYTLEFYRPSGATVDTTTILDNVSFTYDRKIQKGLIIQFL